MAKLLQLSRTSKGISNVVRAWWALRSQKRRRQSPSQPLQPAAPVITGGWFEWDATQVGLADVGFGYTFQHGTFPQARFEVWLARSSQGWAYNLLETMLSNETDDHYQLCASSGGETLRYKMRYRYGDIIGPFSNEWDVVVPPYGG